MVVTNWIELVSLYSLDTSRHCHTQNTRQANVRAEVPVRLLEAKTTKDRQAPPETGQEGRDTFSLRALEGTNAVDTLILTFSLQNHETMHFCRLRALVWGTLL